MCRDAERKAVKAVVRAFGIELEAFRHGFVDGLDPIFERWKNQYNMAVPLNLPPTAQSYFAVYDGNAGTLGRLLPLIPLLFKERGGGALTPWRPSFLDAFSDGWFSKILIT